MQCGVNQNRLFSHIDIILEIHSEHCGNTLFNCSIAVEQLDHRRIKPDTVSATGNRHSLAACLAFTDNGGRRHVTGFQRVHKCLAVLVDQHSADRTNLFSHERAVDL